VQHRGNEIHPTGGRLLKDIGRLLVEILLLLLGPLLGIGGWNVEIDIWPELDAQATATEGFAIAHGPCELGHPGRL